MTQQTREPRMLVEFWTSTPRRTACAKRSQSAGTAWPPTRWATSSGARRRSSSSPTTYCPSGPSRCLENGFATSNIEAMRRHVEGLWRAARDAGLCDDAPAFKYHRGRAPHAKAQAALERHLLYNEMAKSTEHYYRNHIGDFAAWAAGEPSRQAFNAQTVSEYIRDKQQTAAAPWTVKSARTR